MFSMSRVVALVFPSLAIELARSLACDDSRAPLAVVLSAPGTEVLGDCSLLATTRLDAVSGEARAFGVRPGQTIAAARARVAALRVRVVARAAVREALARVAELGLGFGPVSAIDDANDGVFVDVTGCSHLFATDGDRCGEATLLTTLQKRVEQLGFPCRGAIARGPLLARAMAAHAPGGPLFVVPPGEETQALGPLPLAALPLDRATRAWLAKLGLRSAQDLARLPRGPLAQRLGAQAKRLFSMLDGNEEPLVAHVPESEPEERAELEFPIDTTEALLFVVGGLAARLGARLCARGLGTERLELGLDAPHGGGQRVLIALPSPLGREGELVAVLRARIEALVLANPVTTVRLRAAGLVPLRAMTGELFRDRTRPREELPRLVAELVAELGPERVGLFALSNRWLDDERSTLVLPGHGQTQARTRLVGASVEPTRWLPSPIACAPFEPLLFVRRMEAVEWWRLGESARDVVLGWVDTGRSSGVAWVELDHRRGERWVRGWVD